MNNNKKTEAQRYEALMERHFQDPIDGISDEEMDWMNTYEESNPLDPNVSEYAMIEKGIVEFTTRGKISFKRPRRKKSFKKKIPVTWESLQCHTRTWKAVDVSIKGMGNIGTKWLNWHRANDMLPDTWVPLPLFAVMLEAESENRESDWMFGKGEELIFVLEGGGRFRYYYLDDDNMLRENEVELHPNQGYWVDSLLPHKLIVEKNSRILYAFCGPNDVNVSRKDGKIVIYRPITCDSQIRDSLCEDFADQYQQLEDLLAAASACGTTETDLPYKPIMQLKKVPGIELEMAEHRKLISENKIIDPNESWRMGYHVHSLIQADWHVLRKNEQITENPYEIFMCCHPAYEFIYVLKGTLYVQLLPRDLMLSSISRLKEKKNGHTGILEPDAIEEYTQFESLEAFDKHKQILQESKYLKAKPEIFRPGSGAFGKVPFEYKLCKGECFGFDASRFYHYPTADSKEAEALFIKWKQPPTLYIPDSAKKL